MLHIPDPNKPLTFEIGEFTSSIYYVKLNNNFKSGLKFLNEMKDGKLYRCTELAKVVNYTHNGFFNALKKSNLPIVKKRIRKTKRIANYITKDTFLKLISGNNKMKRTLDYMKRYVKEYEKLITEIPIEEWDPISKNPLKCHHLLSLPDDNGYRTCLYCKTRFYLPKNDLMWENDIDPNDILYPVIVNLGLEDKLKKKWW